MHSGNVLYRPIRRHMPELKLNPIVLVTRCLAEQIRKFMTVVVTGDPDLDVFVEETI